MLGQFFLAAVELEDDAFDEDDVDDAFGVAVLLAAWARVAPPTRTLAEIVSAITAVLNRCLMSLTSFPHLGSVWRPVKRRRLGNPGGTARKDLGIPFGHKWALAVVPSG
jgi:hypothetical protein